MRYKLSEPRQPSLEEMLSDPIVWMVMKSDGVDEHELRSLLKRVAADLVVGGASTSGVETMAEPSGGYRRGVGIMLLNNRNEVLVGQRTDAEGDAWQMPQGGIDPGETPRQAALRELGEEVGTDKAEILAESRVLHRYDLPSEIAGRMWGGRFRGQTQIWFAMRFLGEDIDINIATEHPEFDTWKWVAPGEWPDLIVPFKRAIYVAILDEFREHLDPKR